MLAGLFDFVRGSLPTAASKVRQTLESSVAGATRRVILAREAVITAAWGFINALRLTTLAGILSWVFGRLFLPFLLLVLRPFIPTILRKYFLWRNWVEDRLGDLADWYCYDKERREKRRCDVKSWEQELARQLESLAKLNAQVALVARNAAAAFCENSNWLAGKYENLRPTEFTGPVAAVVSERSPVPRFSLWRRFIERIDLDVERDDQAITRIQSDMARNQESISYLESQKKSRSAELAAIMAQVKLCEREDRDKFILKSRPKSERINRPVRQSRPESRFRENASLPPLLTTTRASVANSVVLRAPPADAIITAAVAVDSPDSAAVIPLPLPSPTPLLALPAPPSPTPEETSTPVAPPLDTRTAEQILVANVWEQISSVRA